MKGLRLLFNSWRNMRFFFWFAVVSSLLFLLMPFLFHEELGSEDYLFPKIFMFFPSILMTEIGLICGCRDITANRLVRSFPIAKELYTRSVPLLVLLLTIGISAAAMIVYFIFLGIIGAEQNHFADTLLIGAIITSPVLLTSGFSASIPGGGMICLYAAAAPVVLISTICGNTVMYNGFGLSLPIAALLSAALLSVSAALMFFIAKQRFLKSNIRINNPVMNYETK